MAEILRVEQLVRNRFLSMYRFEGKNDKEEQIKQYIVASRAQTEDALKIRTRRDSADGVAIFSLYGPERDRVVLVRQYRYPVDDFVYELPAGLAEPGEDYHDTAVRELHEETGLTLTVLRPDPLYEKPRFTSVGMTDEACAIVYGYAAGEVSTAYMEKSEEIEIVLADRKEARRILEEERVSLVTAIPLQHFIAEADPFAYLCADRGCTRI